MFTDTQIQSAFFKKESVQKEVKASLSQKATLSCEVADVKTGVKWYKDGKLLTSSKTIHAESKGKSRQLVIESVEKRDAGEYICETGSEKLAFKLHVEGKHCTLIGRLGCKIQKMLKDFKKSTILLFKHILGKQCNGEIFSLPFVS